MPHRGPNPFYLAPHRSEAEIRSRRIAREILKIRNTKICKTNPIYQTPINPFTRLLIHPFSFSCKTNPIQKLTLSRRRSPGAPGNPILQPGNQTNTKTVSFFTTIFSKKPQKIQKKSKKNVRKNAKKCALLPTFRPKGT